MVANFGLSGLRDASITCSTNQLNPDPPPQAPRGGALDCQGPLGARQLVKDLQGDALTWERELRALWFGDLGWRRD